VERRDAEVVRLAWRLRVKADYKPEFVRAEELRDIMKDAARVLSDLGGLENG
jgi:hypothetical protein